jgi:hypothetical protein
MDKTCNFLSLPREIRWNICYNMSPKEVLIKCSVAKSFNKMCKRNTFWENYVKHRYNPKYYADENVITAYSDDWEFFFEKIERRHRKRSWKKLALWLEGAKPIIQIQLQPYKIIPSSYHKVPISRNDQIIKYLERGSSLSGPKLSLSLENNVLTFNPLGEDLLDYDFPTICYKTIIDDIYVDGINIIEYITIWLCR